MTAHRPVDRSMLGTIVALEIRMLLRDRAVFATLAVFAIVLAVAAYLAGRHATQHAAALDAASADQVRHLEAAVAEVRTLEAQADSPIGANDPRDAAAAGRKIAAALATLPAGPLAAVSAGLRDVRPNALRVTTGAQWTASTSAGTAMVGPSRQAAGTFDPAFVFVVLFPLVVIALSYDLLSGERERGTLALLLSQPLTQRELVVGKATARAAAVLIAGVLTAWLGVLVGGGDLAGAGALPRTLAYTGGIVAYALFWFALAIVVNSRSGTSARNALILIGIWLAAVVIVPGLLRVLVETRYPPPSRVALVNEAREAAEEAESELGALQGTHGIEAGSEQAVAGPKAFTATQRAAAVEEELARRTEPVIEAFRTQLEAQQDWVSRFQFASPAVVLQELLNDAAGTGSHRQQDFERQVDAFQRERRVWFGERVRAGQPLTPADYAAMPAFEYREESVRAFGARMGWRLLGIGLPAVLLLLIAAPGLRRVGRLST